MRTNTEYNVYCLVLGGLILVPRLSPWPGGMPTPNFPITSKKNYGQGESFFEKKISNVWKQKSSTKYVDCLSGVSQAPQYLFNLIYFSFCLIYEHLTKSDSCQIFKQKPFLSLISVILTNPCEIKLSQFIVTSRILSYQY